ncbi:hypothetical protein BrE312_1404 [Brenneria sp. EniD312]|nr:hypothetical protein BrE312_1404 [Brenneria sp. EniD312]
MRERMPDGLGGAPAGHQAEPRRGGFGLMAGRPDQWKVSLPVK